MMSHKTDNLQLYWMNNARRIQVLNQELIFRDPAIQPRLHIFRLFWAIIGEAASRK